MIEDLITKNRSCRRFLQKEPVPVDTLRWLVNLARLSASSANLQPLKYILSNSAPRLLRFRVPVLAEFETCRFAAHTSHV